MSLKLDTHQDLLKEKIKSHHRKLMEARQLYYRLQKLLPSQIRSIQSQQARSGPDLKKIKSYARTNRALASDDHLKLVDQLSEVSYEIAFHKVMHETHMMLFNARQSLAGFQKQARFRRLDSNT